MGLVSSWLGHLRDRGTLQSSPPPNQHSLPSASTYSEDLTTQPNLPTIAVSLQKRGVRVNSDVGQQYDFKESYAREDSV